MLTSMTGFARIEQTVSWGQIIWELRSVNHRHLDIQARLPHDMLQYEPQIRKQVRAHLKRGRIEVHLRIVPHAEQAGREIDTAQLQWLQQTLQQLQHSFPQGQLQLMDVLSWPGMLQKPALDQVQLAQDLQTSLQLALQDLSAMRQREGQRLGEMLQAALAAMQQHIDNLQQQIPKQQVLQRQQLQARLQDLQVNCDAQRLEQEVAILCQKHDFMEEVTRLQSHVEEFLGLIRKGGVVGRRMDFLLQEFVREANTLSSKAPSIEIGQVALDFKVLIEQCREQVQNIE